MCVIERTRTRKLNLLRIVVTVQSQRERERERERGGPTLEREPLAMRTLYSAKPGMHKMEERAMLQPITVAPGG